MPASDALFRPYVDPARCRSESTSTYSIDDGTLHLFAGPREAPIPIQVIGDPVEGPTGPFVIVQRFFGPVTVVAPTVPEVYANGNGAATWTLPDTSTAYVRSRGLSQDELVDVIGRLTARARDTAVPGFDYRPNTDNSLGLVAEALNTNVTGSGNRLTCSTPSGWRYTISAVDGDPLYVYANVIDRPVPLEVGIEDGTVVIIGGDPQPDAPTLADIVDADPDIWQAIPSETSPAPPATVPSLAPAGP